MLSVFTFTASAALLLLAPTVDAAATTMKTSDVGLVLSVYRVTLNLPEVAYSTRLGSRENPANYYYYQHHPPPKQQKTTNTAEFRENAQLVRDALDFLFADERTYRNASVLAFRYHPVIGTLVLVDVAFVRPQPYFHQNHNSTMRKADDRAFARRIRTRFDEAIGGRAQIGWLAVASEGFELVELYRGACICAPKFSWCAYQ